MPRGQGRKDLTCTKCGQTFLVNNGFHAHSFRCDNCPLRCCFCGGDIPRESPGGGLRDRRCKRCMAMRERVVRRTPHGQFRAAYSIAKQRGIAWELTEAEYTALRSLPCHYCGFGLPPTGAGLDRLDPSLGYCVGNVVPCCMECNLAKNANFTHDEMRLIGAVIAQIKAAREQNGQTHETRLGSPRKY